MTEYLNLLSPHLREKPRFAALAAAVLSQAEDLLALLDQYLTAFSLENAIGAQLDQLGALVNLPRPESAVSDADYRLWLRARLAARHWNGTNADLPRALAAAFPDREAAMRDHADGTVTLSLSGDPPPFPLRELFPVPAGVKVNE